MFLSFCRNFENANEDMKEHYRLLLRTALNINGSNIINASKYNFEVLGYIVFRFALKMVRHFSEHASGN